MDITTITKHKNTLIAILIAFLLWAFPAPLYQLWLGLSYVFSYFSYLLPTLYFLEKIALVLAVIAAGFYSYQYYQLANAQTKTKELQDNRKRAYNFAFAIGSFTLLYLIIIRPVARSTAAQLLLTHLPSMIVYTAPVFLVMTGLLAWVYLNVKFAKFSYAATLISCIANIAFLIYNPVYAIPLRIASFLPFLTSCYHKFHDNNPKKAQQYLEKTSIIAGAGAIIGLILYIGLSVAPGFFQPFFIYSGFIGLLALAFSNKSAGVAVSLGLLLAAIAIPFFMPALITFLPPITLLAAVIQIYHMPTTRITDRKEFFSTLGEQDTLCGAAYLSIMLAAVMNLGPANLLIASVLKLVSYVTLALTAYLNIDLDTTQPLVKHSLYSLMIGAISFSMSTICTLFPPLRLLAPVTSQIGTISSAVSLACGAAFNLSHKSTTSKEPIRTI